MRSRTVTTRADRVTTGLVVPSECRTSIPRRWARSGNSTSSAASLSGLTAARTGTTTAIWSSPIHRRTVGAASRAQKTVMRSAGRAARSAVISSRAYVSEPPTAPGTRYSRLSPTCTAHQLMTRRQALCPGERGAERRRAPSRRAAPSATRGCAGPRAAEGGEVGRPSQARELGGADRAPRLDLAPLAQQARQRAHGRRRAAASARPSRPTARREQRQLGGEQRRGTSAQQRRPGRCARSSPSGCARAGATCCALGELVVVVDARRAARSRRAPPPERRRSERSTSSQYMKKSRGKPPSRSHAARGTARQAPEANATSRGPAGAPRRGSPAWPAHAMPVKCTTPPLVLTIRAAVRGHEPHPGAPSRGPRLAGARIASAKPGAGTASGFRNTSRSPSARAAPALQPAAKPRCGLLQHDARSGRARARARPCRPRTRCRRRPARRPRRAAPRSGRERARRSRRALLKVTTTTESAGGRATGGAC